MNKLSKLSPIPVAFLALSWYADPAFAPEYVPPPKVRVHPLKTYYDSVPQDQYMTKIYKLGELTIEPCIMPRRVRSKIDNKCYLPSKLPEKQQ